MGLDIMLSIRNKTMYKYVVTVIVSDSISPR